MDKFVRRRGFKPFPMRANMAAGGGGGSGGSTRVLNVLMTSFILFVAIQRFDGVCSEPCPYRAVVGQDFTISRRLPSSAVQPDTDFVWIATYSGVGETKFICSPSINNFRRYLCDASHTIHIDDFSKDVGVGLREVDSGDADYHFEWSITIDVLSVYMHGMSLNLWSNSTSGTLEQVLPDCELQVYFFESQMLCEDVEVSEDGSKLIWSCSVDGVFPGVGCDLEYNNTMALDDSDGALSTIVPEVTNTQTNGTFYNSYCTVEVPASLLGAGVHKLAMSMYPDVINGTQFKQRAYSKEFFVAKHFIPEAEESDGLDPGAVAGIVVGVGLVLGAACFLLGLFVGKRWWNQHNRPQGDQAPDGSNSKGHNSPALNMDTLDKITADNKDPAKIRTYNHPADDDDDNNPSATTPPKNSNHHQHHPRPQQQKQQQQLQQQQQRQHHGFKSQSNPSTITNNNDDEDSQQVYANQVEVMGDIIHMAKIEVEKEKDSNPELPEDIYDQPPPSFSSARLDLNLTRSKDPDGATTTGMSSVDYDHPKSNKRASPRQALLPPLSKNNNNNNNNHNNNNNSNFYDSSQLSDNNDDVGEEYEQIQNATTRQQKEEQQYHNNHHPHHHHKQQQQQTSTTIAARDDLDKEVNQLPLAPPPPTSSPPSSPQQEPEAEYNLYLEADADSPRPVEGTANTPKKPFTVAMTTTRTATKEKMAPDENIYERESLDEVYEGMETADELYLNSDQARDYYNTK